MKENLKKIIYVYERAAWYLGQAYGEAHKPLVLLNESLMIITMLKVYGYNLGWTFYATIFILLNLAGVVMGKLISWLGIIHYTTSLGNIHSPELMDVIDRLNRIENKIK